MQHVVASLDQASLGTQSDPAAKQTSGCRSTHGDASFRMEVDTRDQDMELGGASFAMEFGY